MNNNNKRQEALKWWKSKSWFYQDEFCRKYIDKNRYPESFTGREIESIYLKEKSIDTPKDESESWIKISIEFMKKWNGKSHRNTVANFLHFLEENYNPPTKKI